MGRYTSLVTLVGRPRQGSIDQGIGVRTGPVAEGLYREVASLVGGGFTLARARSRVFDG